MINQNCVVRYCQKCKTKLNQNYVREDDNAVVRTRKCPKCGFRNKTVEILLEDYNSTVRKLNSIIGVVSDTKTH
jgi:transcriptional regulator NrdR family protein